MTIDPETLREIEQLLRQALAKLGPEGAFRQRVLLQMSLFEVERSLRMQERRTSTDLGPGHDMPEERSA